MTDNSKDKKQSKKLRSEDWFNNPAEPDQTAIYFDRYQTYGLTRDELQTKRPVIGIAQTGSDLSPCNRHHIDLAKRVRDGIRDAGGVPFEFPVHPIFEQGRRPTAALDRNLAFLGLVETLHGYPLDGVVLTTGCDKTTPATIMAAAALDLPAIVFSGGPMLNGWDGEKRMGSGSIIWESRELHKAGKIDFGEFMDRLALAAPSIGHCNTMGTALTMNCAAEAMGLSLPGCAAIPAPHQARAQMAYTTGKRIVEMVKEELTPSKIITKDAIINAIQLVSAIGGSSNAPVHIQAIANQVKGLEDIKIDDWQEYGESIPLIVNCQPAGEYLGEDFYRAGGVPAVMHQLFRSGFGCEDVKTVNGKTIGENYQNTPSRNSSVIRSCESPLMNNAGFAIMSGNLFDSALMKKSVIGETFRKQYLSNPDSPNVFKGRAIIFDGSEDYHHRIDDPSLKIDADCILVMRYCGPVGYPGSAEVVNMLPPDYLVKQGITELPCIGDGRQSGTSASPSILNASPEAAVGGGLALLKMNDLIEIDLNTNKVNLIISDEELIQRKADLKLPEFVNQTPWQEIYRKSVNQLSEGGSMVMDKKYQNIIATFGTPRHSH